MQAYFLLSECLLRRVKDRENGGSIEQYRTNFLQTLNILPLAGLHRPAMYQIYVNLLRISFVTCPRSKSLGGCFEYFLLWSY